MPDRVPAGHHALLGGAVVFFGTHPKTKRRFVVQSIEGGGWGGRPFEDGESGTVSVCQGDVRNGSIEGIELKCPVVVESRELRPDSCGAGKFRGGLGIDMRVKNLVEGKWNFEMPRRSKRPPWGIRGGTPGEPGGYLLKRPGEKKFTMMGGFHIPVAIGAEAIVRTGGGGGWGEPFDRPPEVVAEDVAEGFISAAAARKLYGVVVRGNMSLDESRDREAAKAARSLRRKARMTEACPEERNERDGHSTALRLPAGRRSDAARAAPRASAETKLRVGKAQPNQFAFVPADIGVESRHLQEARPRRRDQLVRRRRQDDAGAGRRRHRHRARRRPGLRHHRQGRADEGGGGARQRAEHHHAGGAQGRPDQDRRRSQGQEGQRLDRGLADLLADDAAFALEGLGHRRHQDRRRSAPPRRRSPR